MWSADLVVERLRSRGDIWESAPGLVGLRGSALALFAQIEERITSIAKEESGEEWRAPAGISFETLARAEYFTSFPQWLTAAGHLPDDPVALAKIADSPDPAGTARGYLSRPAAALTPAVCYHVYEALAGTTLGGPRLLTLQGTCWRHEGERTRPLERGWAFTMREIVCLGSTGEVESFRRRMMNSAVHLAEELGLDPKLAVASDPFFAPSARGKALLQRIKALKHEMLLPIGGANSIAAASFNHHETFFGDTFDIRLQTGAAASSGCVAFGLERWLLAFLVVHGTEPSGWPHLERYAASGGLR